MKILHAKVDELLSKLTELKDIIQEITSTYSALRKQSWVMLKKDDTSSIEILCIAERQRKRRGEIVIIVPSKKLEAERLHVNVLDNVALIAVEIKVNEGDKIIATIDMPPKIWTQNNGIYQKLIDATIKSAKTLLQNTEDKSKRIILDKNFNRNIDWKKMEAKPTENQ